MFMNLFIASVIAIFVMIAIGQGISTIARKSSNK